MQFICFGGLVALQAQGGFLDAAAEGSAIDGLAGKADITAAAASRALIDSARKELGDIANNDPLLGVLDLADGKRDNQINVSKDGTTSPDVRQGHYSDALFYQEGNLLTANADFLAGQPNQLHFLKSGQNLAIDPQNDLKSDEARNSWARLQAGQGVTPEELQRLESSEGSKDLFKGDDWNTWMAATEVRINSPAKSLDELAAQAGNQASATNIDLTADSAARTLLDRLDGVQDGLVAIESLRLPGESWQQGLFNVPANDGSGQTVMQAALAKLISDYENVDKAGLPDANVAAGAWAVASNIGLIDGADGSTVDGKVSQAELAAAAAKTDNGLADDTRATLQSLAGDANAFNPVASLGGNQDGTIRFDTAQAAATSFNKAYLGAALAAKIALTNGIPLDDKNFDQNLAGEFLGWKVIDGTKLDNLLNRMLADPEVRSDLDLAMVSLIPDAQARAMELMTEITSPYYASALRYMEKHGQAAQAKQRMQSDLSALASLEEGLSRQNGSPFLINGASPVQVASGKLAANMITTVLNEGDFTSIDPQTASMAITDTLQAAIDLRLTGAGLRGADKIISTLSNLDAIAGELEQFRGQLAGIGNTLAKLFGMIQKQGGSITELTPLLAGLDSPELSATISPAAKEQTMKLLSILNKHGLLSSAAGVFATASSAYRLANASSLGIENSWDRLSASLGFVATLSYSTALGQTGAFLADTVAGRPTNPQFSAALERPLAKLTQEIATTGGRGATVGAAILKGIGFLSDLAGGSIMIALGIRDIVSGANSGDGLEVATGSLGIASGLAWGAAGIAAVLGSAMAAPLTVAGLAFAVIPLLVMRFFEPTPNDQFADSLTDRWLPLGIVKQGAHFALSHDFFLNHYILPEDSAGS